MDVDEAGRHDLAGGIDLCRCLGNVAHDGDPPAAQSDVRDHRLGPGAVDDEAVADREIDRHRVARSADVASTSTASSSITTP